MPSWLSMDFVALNWQPLLVALVLGYILGWLFTGIPNKRHANEAEDRAAGADTRLRKAERELADVRRESEQHKTRAAAVQVELDGANTRIRDLESAAAAQAEAALDETDFPDGRGALPNELSDIDEMDDGIDEAMRLEADELAVAAALQEDGPIDDEEEWEIHEFGDEDEVYSAGFDSDDETQTMLIPAVDAEEEEWQPGRASADLSKAFSSVAESPDYSGITTSKDIALTEAYARVTTLQAELDRNDAVLRARQADADALRAELAAANAARHELETRLIRAREDVASELAVLASTMIKMKDDAIARADARVAALTAELNSLRGQRTSTPTAAQMGSSGASRTPAQIPAYVPPKATASGWIPGSVPDDDGDLVSAASRFDAGGAETASAQDDLPEMAKAVKAMVEENEAVAEDASDESDAMPGLDPLTDANNQSNQA